MSAKYTPSETSQLNRSVSLWQLTLFGTGTILGAGIYVLIGKVAAEAGYFSPWAFLLAASIAGITACSYAELSARYPRSAGEVVYVAEAFKSNLLSRIIGWSIVMAGAVSSATLANGLVGYVQVFVDWPDGVIIILPLMLLGYIAIIGIQASMNFTAVITLIEILGLLIIIFIAGDNLATLPDNLDLFLPPLEGAVFGGIFAGAFIAFYAFIGFEDMVNVAEEVIEPHKTLPKAIFLSFIIATSLYLLVSTIAVLSMPLNELSRSSAPFADLMLSKGHSAVSITLISLIAIVNGILVQIIMASRILYGMAGQGNAPKFMGSVNASTATPAYATVFIIAVIALFALLLPLTDLAKTTSFIILAIFVVVNLSLIIIKRNYPCPANVKAFPMAIPVLGLLLTLGFLIIAVIN